MALTLLCSIFCVIKLRLSYCFMHCVWLGHIILNVIGLQHDHLVMGRCTWRIADEPIIGLKWCHLCCKISLRPIHYVHVDARLRSSVTNDSFQSPTFTLEHNLVLNYSSKLFLVLFLVYSELMAKLHCTKIRGPYMRKKTRRHAIKTAHSKTILQRHTKPIRICTRYTCTPHPHTRKHTPNRHIIAQT